MNIKITHKWLLDYLETDATPEEIQKYLSLCGPSVETVEKIEGGDYIYDIEVTSNRIDSASVYGIALECQAILPMFGKTAKLKNNPLNTYRLTGAKDRNDEILKVSFESSDLCSRFTIAVFENVITKPSPQFIQDRLRAIGIKVINNVVDISNYLMVSLGQPTHVFDYDKVKDHVMKMRESRKNEKITTLDEKELTLPGGDIVIEDGSGELIDLCGIMGGFNSSYTEKTKRVILFVQTYNKARIRKTTMLTNQRTIAATYFEKGLDEERVAPTLAYGMELMKTYADGKLLGSVIDIAPKKYEPVKIKFTQQDMDRRIGIVIPREKIIHILSSLGFGLQEQSGTYEATVPSFRRYDVSIVEDLVEEIARIYGYFNLPNNLSPARYVKQPAEFENLFVYQNRLKQYLKHLGLHEVLNYSMISKELIENFNLEVNDHLTLANVLSEDIKYLRTTLLPSLLKDIHTNEGKKENLGFFELAKTYIPRKDDLPEEKYFLSIGITSSYTDLKGIVEGILKELNISNTVFKPFQKKQFTSVQSELTIGGDSAGYLGQLKSSVREAYGIKSDCYLAELDFQKLIDSAKTISPYTPLHPFAVVKLDLTYTSNPDTAFETIREMSYKISKLLQKIEVTSRYRDNVTLRFHFSDPQRNVTEDEAKAELQTIKKTLRL